MFAEAYTRSVSLELECMCGLMIDARLFRGYGAVKSSNLNGPENSASEGIHPTMTNKNHSHIKLFTLAISLHVETKEPWRMGGTGLVRCFHL